MTDECFVTGCNYDADARLIPYDDGHGPYDDPQPACLRCARLSAGPYGGWQRYEVKA